MKYQNRNPLNSEDTCIVQMRNFGKRAKVKVSG